MPYQRTVFLSALTIFNNERFSFAQHQDKSTISNRIEDVISLMPVEILQSLNKDIFKNEQEEITKQLPYYKSNYTTITIAIFKEFLSLTQEEQMTIQKFLYCPCFYKIIEYMAPEDQLKTFKHIKKFIDLIQQSTAKHKQTYGAKTKQTTLKNIPDITDLINKFKNYINQNKPATSSTKTETASEIIYQLQKTINAISCTYNEEFLYATFYQALDINKPGSFKQEKTAQTLKNISDNKTRRLSKQKKQSLQTKNTKKSQKEIAPNKRTTKSQKTPRAKKIAKYSEDVTIKKPQEAEKSQEEIAPNKRTAKSQKTPRAKKIAKYSEDVTIKKPQEAEKSQEEIQEEKKRYHIISLIFDTPHYKILTDEYIANNPEIKTHELYPILQAITNYIYRDNNTEQKSIDEKKSLEYTTPLQKRQIFILSLLHNIIILGEKQLIEFNRNLDELQAYANKLPDCQGQQMRRIIGDSIIDSLNKYFISSPVQKAVKTYKTHKDDRKKFTKNIQDICTLQQTIKQTEQKQTHLELSSKGAYKIFALHFNTEEHLQVIKNATINHEQIEQLRSGEITIESLLPKAIQDIKIFPIKKESRKITLKDYSQKKSSIQDIVQYINEKTKRFTETTAYALYIKDITTQSAQPQEHNKFSTSEELIQDKQNTKETIQFPQKEIQQLLGAIFYNIQLIAAAQIIKNKNSGNFILHNSARVNIEETKLQATQTFLALLQVTNIKPVDIAKQSNKFAEKHQEQIDKNTSEKTPSKDFNFTINRAIYKSYCSRSTHHKTHAQYKQIIQNILLHSPATTTTETIDKQNEQQQTPYEDFTETMPLEMQLTLSLPQDVPALELQPHSPATATTETIDKQNEQQQTPYEDFTETIPLEMQLTPSLPQDVPALKFQPLNSLPPELASIPRLLNSNNEANKYIFDTTNNPSTLLIDPNITKDNKQVQLF